ncbi:MAG: DUF177 domain-containing protein [Chakrabartia sp.]
MNNVAPELSRPLRFDTIAGVRHPVIVTATPEECTLLADRFGLGSVKSLTADVTIAVKDEQVDAVGTLTAQVDQLCVVTGEAIPTPLSVPFHIRFIPVAAHGGSDEIEIDADDLDIIEHDGQAIDLGEAIAQTLGLALDPFPRGPNATTILKRAGVMQEEDVRPLTALSGLKDLLPKT